MSAWKILADNTLRKVNFSELLSIASIQRTNDTAIEIVKPLRPVFASYGIESEINNVDKPLVVFDT